MSLLSRRFRAQRQRPRLLIVGGGFAGLAAARHLVGKPVDVTLISQSAHAEWLPNVHELISRRKTPSQLQLDLAMQLGRWQQPFVGARVVDIDRTQQRVITENGARYDYDVLILATGSQARDDGISGVKAHALIPRSIDNAFKLGNALTRLAALPGKRPLVLAGAGIEGLEMLGEILQRFGDAGHWDIHLVDPHPSLFPDFPGLHERLLKAMRGQVTLHMGRKVVAVDADKVFLDNGDILASRITVWSAGRQANALPALAGLASADKDADVLPTLQSRHDPLILLAGDTAQLPATLPKQAYHAQDMGKQAADNALRLLEGEAPQPFKPWLRPQLMSFGERDGVMFYQQQALASAGVLALKEGIYRLGFQQWQQHPREIGLLSAAKALKAGISELEAWQLLLRSADSRLFSQR